MQRPSVWGGATLDAELETLDAVVVVDALSDRIGGASHSALQFYRLSTPLNVAASRFG
jgi:hypothetical protein